MKIIPFVYFGGSQKKFMNKIHKGLLFTNSNEGFNSKKSSIMQGIKSATFQKGWNGTFNHCMKLENFWVKSLHLK
jgi:hypothetical protein